MCCIFGTPSTRPPIPFAAYLVLFRAAGLAFVLAAAGGLLFLEGVLRPAQLPHDAALAWPLALAMPCDAAEAMPRDAAEAERSLTS